MNLIAFIRLIIQHIKVLTIVPIVLVLMVFLLLDDSKRNYLTSTTIYTGFASGSSVDGPQRTDYFAINIKFDNLFENMKSRSTREEIVLRSLAFYLSKESISELDMSLDNQELLFEIFPNELIDKLVTKGSEEITYNKLSAYYHGNYENEIYYLLNSNESLSSDFFGLEKLMSLDAVQEGSSDLVKFSYETSDAGICYHTIRIALGVILHDVKTIRSAESKEIVAYFLKETLEAKRKLDMAEEELSALMTDQKIINYYEQTKYLAHRREEFEVAFQGEKLQLVAARAAKEEAENKMSLGEGIKLQNKSILELRTEIRKISSKIAHIEIGDKADISARADSLNPNLEAHEESKNLNDLRSKFLVLKSNLENEVSRLYDLKNSSTGLTVKSIVDAWLKAAIEEEEYTARIEQYISFRDEFEENYARFSSLGSLIKQMERKIGVLEEDYLSLMESLNESKLKQESLDRLTSLKVVDQPFYPVNAEKSKKPLLMLLALVAGFVLTLGILIILEFLDDTIKTPERLNNKTGLEVAGGFPVIRTNESDQFTSLLNVLIGQVASRINQSRFKHGASEEPYVVFFFSTRTQEGKSTLARKVAQAAREAGERTLLISSKEEQEKQNDDNISYQPNKGLVSVSLNSKEILRDKNWNDYRLVLFEVPAIITNDLPIGIMQQANLSILIAKSNRTWSAADSKALANYAQLVPHKMMAIINGAHPNHLESIVGEIPKERGRLRTKIKELLRLKFKRDEF